MVDPQKRAFLSFEIKNIKNFFFLQFFFWFSFKNSRPTHIILISIFENEQKTIINPPKRPKWRFLTVNHFFCAFSKIPTKRTFVCLLFLKLNQSHNMKKTFLGGFSAKTKSAFFRGSKIVLLKSQISNLYFCVCSMPILAKKY